MRQIQQYLDPFEEDVMALLAPDTGHEPDPAGIMLLRRIVQTLRRRHAIHKPCTGHYSFSGGEFATTNRAVPELEPKAAGAAHTSLQAYLANSVISPRSRQVQLRISMRRM